MSDRTLSALLEMQSQGGAFPSRVGEAGLPDETCFVAALVALALGEIGGTGGARGEAARGRALDFVERCGRPEAPGAFGFYPADGTGPRVAGDLPADADDTAVAWLALLDAGRRDVAAACAAFADRIGPAALTSIPSDAPPWVRPGAVRTWLVARHRDNPVDLAVNANVLALAARIGMGHHPAALGARASLLAAAAGGHDPAAFARRLSPYYASPSEIALAVRRAIERGADGLAPCAIWLAGTAERDPFRADKPLFCDRRGRPVWRSPALQLARALAHAGPNGVDGRHP